MQRPRISECAAGGTRERGNLMRAPRKPTRGCADFEVVEQASIGAEPVEIAREA